MGKAQDIQSAIAQRILADLAAGAPPWENPYVNGLGSRGLRLPRNIASGKSYRGINVLQLWYAAEEKGFWSPTWGTFKQWKAADRQVARGQKGTPIIFWSFKEDEETGEKRCFLRYFTVFNEAQLVDAVAPAYEVVFDMDEADAAASARLERAAAVLGVAVERTTDPIPACYLPGRDLIRLPAMKPGTEAATLAHELAHATGAKGRLARTLDYAEEEFVAEMASAFVCAELQLPYTTQHAAYLAEWKKGYVDAEKGERALIRAISAAGKAAAMIADALAAKDEEKGETTSAVAAK